MAIARQYVQTSAFTPLPFGLLSALGPEIRSPGDTHWQTGVTYEPLCGNAGTTYDECLAVTGTGLGPIGSPAAKIATGGLDQRGATPFAVYAQVDCSAPGFWDRASDTVGDLITRSEQWQVERAFWTGLAAGQPVVYPHLASDSTVVDDLGITLQTGAVEVVSGGSLDVVEGIGRLEAEIASCYDGVAVLHVPRVLNTAMIEASIVTREGPRYRTASGNVVVFGAGYPGTSPAGVTTSGVAWVYATGSMFIYRSSAEIFPIRDSIDRSDNTIHAIAERKYVIGWDCCHYAIPITIGGTVAGEPDTYVGI